MGNWLSSLFSRNSSESTSKSQVITSTDQALLQVKIARDKVKKERKKNDKIVAALHEKAREMLGQDNKDRAKFLLRRRKYLLVRMQQLENQLHSLESMIDRIEEKAIEKQVFDGLREGTDELKKLQSEMDIDSIDALMDDSREAMQKQEEISQALSQQLNEDDEDDVQESLQELEKSMLETDLEKASPATHTLPSKEPTDTNQEEQEQESADAVSDTESPEGDERKAVPA